MHFDLMSPSEALQAFNWFFAVGLFVMYTFVEMLDSYRTLSLTRHLSIRTANTVFVLYLILGVEIFAIVSNYLYILPTALGGWLGTYLLIEREKKVRPLPKK